MAKRRILTAVLAVFVGLPVTMYLGLTGYYMEAEKSIIYKPSREIRAREASLVPASERMTLKSSDGTQLVAWILRSQQNSKDWIYFLHGSSGNATTCQKHWAVLHDLGVNALILDYRGYGESSGSPSENGLYEDGEAGYQALIGRYKLDPAKVIVYGHSLGAAVATHIASERPVGGLVIEGGLTSLVSRGRELFPYLPISLIVRDRFDAASDLTAVKCPTLIMHAHDDRAVPIHYGHELYSQAHFPKRFIELRGGHGDAVEVDKATVEQAISRLLSEADPDYTDSMQQPLLSRSRQE